MILHILRNLGLLAVLVMLGCTTAATALAVDREKLLAEPGVYGTFAAFRIDAEWGKLDQATRIAHLNTLRGVVEQHREKLAIDTYLLRGLSDHADFLLRVHATELKDTQQLLVDLQNSAFGRYVTGVVVLNGLTKKPNYVPGFSDQVKSDLKASSESGPYAVVIPIRKDTEWWSLPQEKRAAMMLEHLGHKDAADAVIEAIEVALADPKARTRDLGGTANTVECGTIIAEAVAKPKS